MRKPKIGLLPLYLKLYDDTMPEIRPRMVAFYNTITEALRERKLDVVTSDFCRVADEFRNAIRHFEEAGADAIVTLHLAYSPSLESADILADSRLPLIVLDTTEAYEFGPQQAPGELMFNHGIHGVQDLCSVLLRKGKPFQIEAGHWQYSSVLDRTAGWAVAAAQASDLKHARVGLLGDPFPGMGDFAVAFDELENSLGIQTVPAHAGAFTALLPAKDEGMVLDEVKQDFARFESSGVSSELHQDTARTGIAVRRWLEEEKLTAFSFNFMSVNGNYGLPVVPFLEASKAMARGIGYAGEGDILTAALVGMLASWFPETTFTEMFCPDWAGDSIFLSHMGEVNVNLLRPVARLKEMDFRWTSAGNPVFASGRLKGGPASIVSIVPVSSSACKLVVTCGEMLDVNGRDEMDGMVHGWFQPNLSVGEFLELYSKAGGTHHIALTYGTICDDIVRLGEVLGWQVDII